MSYDLAFWGMWIAAALFFLWLHNRKDAVLTDAPLKRMRRDEIIRAYGKVLEQSAHQGRLYRCESELPFPKHVVHEALESALAESMDKELRENLEVGFLELEGFLPQEEYEQVKALNVVSQNLLSTAPNSKTQLRNLLEYRSVGQVDPADKENVLQMVERLGLTGVKGANADSILTAVAARRQRRLEQIQILRGVAEQVAKCL